jgi:hypothetical protein
VGRIAAVCSSGRHPNDRVIVGISDPAISTPIGLFADAGRVTVNNAGLC